MGFQNGGIVRMKKDEDKIVVFGIISFIIIVVTYLISIRWWPLGSLPV